jgi:hypothetical protein
MVAATTMLSGAVGFGLAGGLLLVAPRSTSLLFVADAITFALAAIIVTGIPSLGGGSRTMSVSGALVRSWGIVSARPHLVVGTLASFLLPISFPALLALAYQMTCDHAHPQCASGGQTYSVLELLLTAGILVGSIVVSRFGAIGSMRIVGSGLMLTGVCSVALAMSAFAFGMSTTVLILMAGALFVASIGNPIYAVANQTALIEAADASNRGSVMATRFGLVQTASIVGTAVGGLITRQAGPLAAYGVLGVGLVLLAMYAIAAGRSTINPLHGAQYEEATLSQANT